jgi:hypothetical protein
VKTRANASSRIFINLSLFVLSALAATFTPPLSAQTAAEPPAAAQEPAAQPNGPPRNPQPYPLDQLRAGMTATAWTVFEGSTPEPMQVEILGLMHGARGPGQDLILARLLGKKPEYTGVVAGMSGSPVYIDGKLLGALSYRIGQFTKEPIAGITPIGPMLDVRNLSANDAASDPSSPASSTKSGAPGPGSPATGPGRWGGGPSPLGTRETTNAGSSSLNYGTTLGSPSFPANSHNEDAERVGDDPNTNFQPMETPLIVSGLDPEAISFWQRQTAGTPLETIAAGGSSTGPASGIAGSSTPGPSPEAPVPATLEPGSSVSMQLVRGDIEIAATCTITYMDPKQLLACGHPVLGAGPVSLPMTTSDVLATVASPLNAFKIINTGVTIGAFNEDRASAIHGVFGASAHMIPMHIAVDAPTGPRTLNADILDLPSLTPIAMQVVLLESLTETNESSEALSYHLTGSIDLAGSASMPLDLWASAGSGTTASLQTVLVAGQQFTHLYSNGARQGDIRKVDLHIQAVPRSVLVTLDQAHFVSSDIAHAGDMVEVEATLRPWQQPERNVRIAFKIPARLASGNVRILVSDAATLDRTLHQPKLNASAPDLATVLQEARSQHAADRIYISLLAPEAQGSLEGQTLTSLPLSMANALEPLRNAQNASLNGESAELAADAPAGGVLSGFQVLDLHIEPGGGLN